MHLRHVLALAILFLPVVALGRAGGGEHYSGGGAHYSSYSGGGGSSYSGYSSYSGGSHGSGAPVVLFFFALLFDYPKVMCPLISLLIVGVIIWFHLEETRSVRFNEAIARFGPGVTRPLAAIVAVLQLHDPGFEEAAFRAKAKKIFLAVQEAWFVRDLDRARAFMSDGVLRRFTSQLALMAKEGVRDAIAEVAVLDVELLDVTTTPFFDVLQVRFDARMRDCDVAVELTDEQARRRALLVPPERFSEIWTFVRRPGAITRPGYDLADGRCPNCGAAYPGGPSAQCAYCKVVVNSGHHDWVLCEITQSEEQQRSSAAVDFGAMRAKDPAFNPYAVEDRALVVFWRMLQARAVVQPALLEAVCTGPMRDHLQREIEERRAQGVRLSYHEAAVGSSQLLALDLGGEVDRAHVVIRWSARTGRAGLDQQAPAEAYTAAHATVFTLERRADAQTPPNRGLATERCVHCGAAQSDENAVVCSFCAAVLGATRCDWVLAEKSSIERWTAARRSAAVAPPRPMAAFRSPTERLRVLQHMAQVARADGSITAQEQALLEALGKRWNVPVVVVDQILLHQDRNAVEDPHVIPGTSDAREFMQTLVDVACVDGRIDRLERRMLDRMANRLRIDVAALDFSSAMQPRTRS